MANEFLDALLERPAKVERMILLTLKTFLNVWILNLIVSHYCPTCFKGFPESKEVLSFEILYKFSPIKAATYLVFFIALWIILWEIVANWLLPYICKLVVWIVQIIFLPLALVVGLVIILIQYFSRSKFKENSKELSKTQEFFNKLEDEKKARFFFGSLFIFHFINTISNSSAGSEMLYFIMDHEKKDFVKSRILGYYTIILVIVIAIWVLKPDLVNWIYYAALAILVLLAIPIAAMRDVLNDLDSNNLTNLRRILPIDLYVDMVDEVVKEHRLSNSYECKSFRKRLILFREYDSDDILCDFPRKKIEIFRFTSEDEIMTLTPSLRTIEKNLKDHVKIIIISNMLPDIVMRNFLVEKGIFFIYAEDEEQLVIGLNKINPLLLEHAAINLPEP